MIPPAEWIHMMGQNAPLARAYVVVQARLLLDAWGTENSTRTYTTAEVGAALWPPEHALGDAVALRKRMIDLLLKSANDELSAYAVKGEATGRRFMGKVVRPWVWSALKRQTIHEPIIQQALKTMELSSPTFDDVAQAIKFARPCSMMPSEYIREIVTVIRDKFDIRFKQGD